MSAYLHFYISCWGWEWRKIPCKPRTFVGRVNPVWCGQFGREQLINEEYFGLQSVSYLLRTHIFWGWFYTLGDSELALRFKCVIFLLFVLIFLLFFILFCFFVNLCWLVLILLCTVLIFYFSIGLGFWLCWSSVILCYPFFISVGRTLRSFFSSQCHCVWNPSSVTVQTSIGLHKTPILA